jgi:osmotically inducible protein OsmC
MTQTPTILYTAKAHTTGGREGGASRTDDGRLDVEISTPGKPGNGTNPEQLFAAGWSACFLSALQVVAARQKIKLSPETAIDAEVGLVAANGDYSIQARLNVSLPGVDRTVAKSLVEGAHEICPYSKATRGNIDVELNVV